MKAAKTNFKLTCFGMIVLRREKIVGRISGNHGGRMVGSTCFSTGCRLACSVFKCYLARVISCRFDKVAPVVRSGHSLATSYFILISFNLGKNQQVRHSMVFIQEIMSIT